VTLISRTRFRRASFVTNVSAPFVKPGGREIPAGRRFAGGHRLP
jgi:hypothetical protein